MRKTFPLLLLASLLLSLPIFLLPMWQHPLSPALMYLHLRVLIPLICFVLPLWASHRGLDPYAAFFPPLLFSGLFLVLMRLPLPFWAWGLSFFLSVLGAATGQEMRRRQRK